ncbi:ribose-5 phosphate isomerase-related protein [Haematococcus lacustris]
MAWVARQSSRSARLLARDGPAIIRGAALCRAGAQNGDYKRAAARLLVDTFVRDGMVLGLGGGEMCSLCIEEVGQRLASGRLQRVRGVATANAAATEAAFHAVPLVSGDDAATVLVSLAIEQAGQLDVEASAIIMGVESEPQQPQLLRALFMAQERAQQLVVLVEEDKVVPRLTGPLPVLIEAEGWEETAEALDDIVIGDAEVWRRSAPGTVPDPRGGDCPHVTAEGHNLLDLRYDGGLRLYGEEEPYHQLEDELLSVPGVVATGLLLGVAAAAVVAQQGSQGPRILTLAVDPMMSTARHQQEQRTA